MFTRRHLLLPALGLILLLVGGVFWLLRGPGDPRKLALGEWKEASSRLRVEVDADQARWRGMGHGSIRYQWLETEHSPYRMQLTYRGDTLEAHLDFPDKDTAVLEPQIWHKLPASLQRQLRDLNRRHNRPEQEFRLLFKRVHSH